MKKLIDKIEIYRFRSIGRETISADSMTIFAGVNNSGKSNILRALNLFFNKETTLGNPYSNPKDYNTFFRGKLGGPREVSITVHFNSAGGAALKEKFSIKRTFAEGEDVRTDYFSTNSIVQERLNKKDGNTKRQFTRFLNKVEYLYIPAVRDKAFVRNLFLKFEDIIRRDAQRGKDFSNAANAMSEILQDKSRDISKEFENFISLSTKASLSSSLTDILGAITIDVANPSLPENNKNKFYIDLFSSGDGVLMLTFPHFIDQL